MRLTPGTRVGPYEVVSLLGAGGMAEVYRAKDTRLGREVAIKVVSEALGGDGAFLERFDREAKLAASLAHPNVVALHDVGFHDGKPYFVTELLQGETLRERLTKGPIPLATALEWAAQMAQGLAAAHERGIVHRDLKPENVFITRDGHVKLLDFGIAKLVEAAQGASPHGLMDATVSPSGGSTGTGMVLGTPGYMSPEQVRGDPVDARTDFFSLGAVLYEMLSGRRAFPAGPVVESGYAILHAEPEPLAATVPSQVAQVVYRCLAKESGRRFQSARDLAFNLELVRTPTGSTAPTATTPGKPAHTSQWRRWLLLLAKTTVLLGVGVATFFVGRSTARPTVPSVEQVTSRQGRVSAARFSPEGRVVFSAAWNGQPLELFSRAPGSPDAQSSGLHDATLLGVSGTGELAVMLRPLPYGYAGRGTLAVLPSAGGAPREVSDSIEYADWSPTGELALVRAVGGRRQLEFPPGRPLFDASAYIVNPRVSPHGDAVAFLLVPYSGSERILMVVDEHSRARALSTAKGGTGLAWLPNAAEVWLSVDNAIWASPLTGVRRLVYQGVSPIQLEDISRTGTVLVDGYDSRREVVFLPPKQQDERSLSGLGNTFLSALSDDGRQVLFTAYLGDRAHTYLRPTDGTPPVRLGPGEALALSPDGKWALSRPEEYRNALSLLPVGTGVTGTIPVAGLSVTTARWSRDGRRIIFMGRPPDDNQLRLYSVPLEGGMPMAIADAVVRAPDFEVSRDDRFVATRDVDQILTIYDMNGGAPIALRELGTNVTPVAWTPDGRLWIMNLQEFPSRIFRYDIRTRRKLEERFVSPADPTGFVDFGHVCITPDGQATAFDYQRVLGNLYLLDGLVPPLR